MAVHLGCTPDERRYHAIYPARPCNGAFLDALLRELYDHAPPIIPICFVMNDGDTSLRLPADFDRSLCRLVVPKWEFPVADCDLKAVRAAFPDALLYWENPAGQTTPKPDTCSPSPFPEGRAWFQHAKRAYGLRGVLVETDIRVLGPDPAAAARAIEQARDTWQDVDAILFETDIYQKFWNGRSEADGVAYNDAIRKAVPSRSSSNTAPRTELRWKKCSIPPSSRMNPNPLSIRSRAIVPVGITPSPPVPNPQEYPKGAQPVAGACLKRNAVGTRHRPNLVP